MMVNLSFQGLPLRRLLGAVLAAAMALPAPAAAQYIAAAQVLETDAVQVMAGEWQANTARRFIAPRTAQGLHWPIARAQALLLAVEGIGREGLDPAQYAAVELRAAIAGGAGSNLDAVASSIFTWLAEDLRDGITPVSARRAYLMDDPDAGLFPLDALMERALATGDVAGALASLNPSHPDYAALRLALASTSLADTAMRDGIRANMDRWRWLPRDLGGQYLLVNAPEFRLRLMVNGEVVRNYRTIVGTPGRNATPQMSEMVEGIIFNPTWTVPQSIVVGEGLGSRVLNNPNWARSRGYTATRSSSGRITVVQQPGPQNALGLMKLDMPNPHAIFLHDTPSRSLFAQDNRALSHGCIRTENALELALTLASLGGGASAEEALRISETGRYTRVPVARQIPVYIGYFTMGVDENGQVAAFDDIYNRDAPVLANLNAPRTGRQLMVARR